MALSKKAIASARAKDLRLRSNYGITLEEYKRILKQQRGTCAICKFPPLGRNSLAVDHDHRTGLVRGLLCMRCNRALGKWQDDDDKVRAAAVYVTNPPASIALGRSHFTAPHRVGTQVRAKKLKLLALSKRK